jgi:tetratricopeptide (TPR) repeat protein
MPYGDPVSVIADAVTAAHVATGTPWWATLGASALCARALTAPASAKTIQASATVRAGSSLAKATARGKNNDGGGDGDDTGAERVGVREVWEAVKELRAAGVGAHPAWLVVGPATQIPFFVCAVMAVRRLTAQGGMNGIDAGGALWFQDLTQPAVDLATMTAPMGPYGGILPVLTAAAMFANINLNFAAAAQQSRGMTIVKLALEWMTLPMLIIGMQLPQAVHCYWLTSSAYALAQNGVLSTRFAREALGTERLAKVTRELASKRAVVAGEDVPMAPHTLELVKAAAQARAENNNALAVNLLLRAARGADGGSETADVALKVDDLARAHPTVLFALGQTYAVLKEWKKSALTYEYSARVEPNPTQRSRALLGAGVARARVGDLNMASEALGEANRLNPTDASIKVALASALKLNGDPEAALDVLRQAAAIQPDIQERYVVPLERELADRLAN